MQVSTLDLSPKLKKKKKKCCLILQQQQQVNWLPKSYSRHTASSSLKNQNFCLNKIYIKS